MAKKRNQSAIEAKNTRDAVEMKNMSPIFTKKEMMSRPVVKQSYNKQTVSKKPSAGKPSQTNIQKQNIKDASRGVNKSPQKSDMLPIKKK